MTATAQDLNSNIAFDGAMNSIHRRNAPSFTRDMVDNVMAKRLDAILTTHSWSKNRYMRKLREEGKTLVRKMVDGKPVKTKVIPPRRVSIRSEREETLNALVRAMIYVTDYDPDAPFLFEVKASVEELATMIGQIHYYEAGYDGENGQYRHGRVAYDCVLGAVEDMAASTLILAVYEFDKKAKQYKAMRIFLRPEFFKSFGLSMKDTKKMIEAARKWRKKKGIKVVNKAKERRKAETIRLSSHERISGLDRPSLKNLLARFRREFTEQEKEVDQVRDAETRVKNALNQSAKEHKTDTTKESIRLEYNALTAQLAPTDVYTARKEIQRLYPSLNPFSDEFKVLLIKALKDGYT